MSPARRKGDVADRIRADGPLELFDIPAWLLWKENADERKIPYYASGVERFGELDTPEERARLVTFAEAVKVFRAGGYDGIGLALGEYENCVISGMDFDACISEAGEISARVQEVVAAADSYTETSPSGRGVHILGWGSIGSDVVRNEAEGHNEIEIYSGKRYFTFTGRRWNGREMRDLTAAAKLAREIYVVRDKPAAAAAKGKVDSQDLEAALEFLANDLDRQKWVIYGHAIKLEFGDAGKDIWMKFSAKWKYYDEADAAKAWKGLRPRGADDGGVTGRSILKDAYDRGWRGSWREPQNLLTEFTAPPYRGSDLPKVLGDFVDEFSEASGIDASILAVSAVVAAASMIDDRWRLYLGSTNWFESARLWAVTIAPPGTGKTPAQDEALSPLKERHGELVRAWQTTVEGLGEEDPRPPLPRLYVTDTTIEALSEVLRDNPRGVLIHYDELVSMLGSFDAYRGGGVSKDRGEYLKLFQGGPNQIERIKRGMVFVPNWGASILAGTTPSALAKLSPKLPNDGLLQRFLIAIGRRKLPISHEVRAVRSVEAYKYTLLRMLQKEARETTVIRMTKEALDLFREWEKQSGLRTEAAATMSEGYESHVSKHAQMVARIALVFHFVETADLDDVPPLSEGAMRLAIKFLEKADLHAMVLYTSLLHSGGPITLAREVARMILSRQSEVIQRRQLTSGVLAFRDADDHARDRAMRLLDDYGWVRPAKGKYDTGHTTRWDVNPAVATLFAAEAERERSRRAMIVEKIAATSEGRRREAE